MSKKFFLLLDFFLLIFFLVIFFLASLPLQPLLSDEKNSPPPFEKIYVGPYDIFTSHEGIFYLSPNGNLEKVRTLCTDYKGTYIIKFAHQCPICGYCYEEETSREGYNCPIWQREVYPHIWEK